MIRGQAKGDSTFDRVLKEGFQVTLFCSAANQMREIPHLVEAVSSSVRGA